MSKQRVLMFGWEYEPYYSGGLGVVTRSIVKNLTQKGIDVLFVLPKIPEKIRFTNEFAKIINASKVKINELRARGKVVKEIEIDSLLSTYTNANLYNEEYVNFEINNFTDDKDEQNENPYGENLVQEVERYANKAAKIAEENPHEIIHTHDWMTARAGVIAKEVSGNPLVMHVHATEYDRTGGNPNQLVYDIEREGMNLADCVIAVSKLTKQKIVQYYGVRADKIKVVHNAIEHFPGAVNLGNKINRTDKIVLFLGRITVQKGGDYLLKAASEVIKHHKKVKFVFVGNGDMLKKLIEESIKLNIAPNVLFAGFMNHNEIDKAYQLADVYIMPSVSEPFGITALEAIKNGTPVIVSKQSGVSEVIKNALKVDFWDTDELANQILAIIKYDQLGKFMAKNAGEELRKVNWASQTDKIVNVYQQFKSRS